MKSRCSFPVSASSSPPPRCCKGLNLNRFVFSVSTATTPPPDPEPPPQDLVSRVLAVIPPSKPPDPLDLCVPSTVKSSPLTRVRTTSSTSIEISMVSGWKLIVSVSILYVVRENKFSGFFKNPLTVTFWDRFGSLNLSSIYLIISVVDIDFRFVIGRISKVCTNCFVWLSIKRNRSRSFKPCVKSSLKDRSIGHPFLFVRDDYVLVRLETIISSRKDKRLVPFAFLTIIGALTDDFLLGNECKAGLGVAMVTQSKDQVTLPRLEDDIMIVLLSCPWHEKQGSKTISARLMVTTTTRLRGANSLTLAKVKGFTR